MISEALMLMIALGSMYAVSLAVAGLAYLAGAGPGVIIIGSTAAGASIYLAICFYGEKYIAKPTPAEDE